MRICRLQTALLLTLWSVCLSPPVYVMLLSWSSFYASICTVCTVCVNLIFCCCMQALRSKAEAIRATELDKVLSKFGEGMSKKQVCPVIALRHHCSRQR